MNLKIVTNLQISSAANPPHVPIGQNGILGLEIGGLQEERVEVRLSTKELLLCVIFTSSFARQ